VSRISHLFLVHMHYYLIHACYQTILGASTYDVVALVVGTLVVGRYFRTPSGCRSPGTSYTTDRTVRNKGTELLRSCLVRLVKVPSM
jgi:hypothetical protein